MSFLVRFALLFSLLFCLSASIAAQQQWTLPQCIDYALSHNLQMQRQRNQQAQAELQLQSSRSARLPSLSASASQNFSFGRSIGVNNTYVNESVNTTSFGLSTDIPLLTGYRIPNTVKQNLLALQATQSDFDSFQNNIKVQVTEAYAQILYSKEALNIALRQLEIDSLQTARLLALLENGRATEADYYQQKAALAQSRQTANSANIQLKNARLQLVLLMELDSFDDFEIAEPNTDIQSLTVRSYSEVLVFALANRPEIAAEELRLQAAEKGVSIAKSQRYPSLTLSGGVNTNYYQTTNYASEPFFDQLKNRLSENISLHLSVPIFNRFQVRNRIKSAQIDVDNQSVALGIARNDLRKQIFQAYNKAIDAQSNYLACTETVESSKMAFDLVRVRYENGRSTIYEYNESKRQYVDNQCRALQAKYDYLFAAKLLAFFAGEEITF